MKMLEDIQLILFILTKVVLHHIKKLSNIQIYTYKLDSKHEYVENWDSQLRNGYQYFDLWFCV